MASLETELSFNALIFSSKQVDSVFDFRRNPELNLLFDFGLDSGRAVLDFENGPVEPLVLLSELEDSGINFRGDPELDSLVDSGLGGMLKLIKSGFTLLNVIFGVDQVFVNFLDDSIEPVDLLKQENLLQRHFGHFLFKVLRHNLDSVGNGVGDRLSLEHSLLLNRGHALFELEDKVFGVGQVTCHLLKGEV